MFEKVYDYNFFFLDQKDRHTGVDAFRRGEKDVLVATDVASKVIFLTHNCFFKRNIYYSRSN